MSFLSGGGGGTAPNPPKPILANIPQLESQANQFAQLGYNLADTTFAQNYPGLAILKNFGISDAYNQLTGPINPAAQNSLTTSAEANALEAFGGGIGAIGPAGSIQRGSTAAGVAQGAQNIEDVNRLAEATVQTDNPLNLIDLTGADIVNLMVGNILAQNQYKQAKFGASVQSQNAQNAALMQQIFAALQTAASVATVASDERFKSDIVKVGTSPLGIPIAEFYFSRDPDKKKYTGTIAQWIKDSHPEAVYNFGGYLFVDYSKLDVEFKSK